ncbi:MAG: TonB-dependent receptor domain-containing protein [Gemmatimonadaceae bacterium]
MRRFLSAALGLALVAGANVTHAQAPGRQNAPPAGNGEMRGVIAAAEGSTPLPHAGVAVRSAADSALVTGAITGADGAFHIRGLRPGAYFIRITLLGFKPHRQDVTLTPAAPVQDLGTIGLSQIAVALEGVQVTEEAPTMSIQPDRNAYRAKDVAPAATNASEILDAVPSVQVDGEGKVSLRGNENVAVQINGRPSPVRGPQLAAYLKSLPANIIDRVEVIPNPSAKYDPEGMAGIINVVLKENAELGLSAGLNASMAETDRYNVAGNVGYQAGRVTLFTNLGVYSDDREILGVNDRERFDALGALEGVTQQSIDGRTGGKGQNLNTTVDFQVTPKTLLTNVFTLNHRDGRDDQFSSYTELDDSRSEYDWYSRPRDTRNDGLMFDYTMALKRTIEPRKHELSTEVRFHRMRDEDRTELWRQPLTSQGFENGAQIEGETNATDALTRQLTAQVDYTRPLGANAKLETGLKSNARWLDRDFLVRKDSLGDGDWVTSNLSNSFNFDETVHAAYGVLSQTAGKFQLQAGLRAERASREFALVAPAEKFPHTYTSLFPSGVVMYSLSDATQLKASYSRRIRRPGTQELNPFPAFFDVQNVFIGNPELSPEYTDAIELSWSRTGKRGSLQFSPFYRHTTDIIRVDINTADTVDNREVTSVSFRNLETSDSWGADLNGSLRFGSRFNGFASFNVFKMVTDGGSESSIGSNAVTWMTRINGTSQITPTFMVQASYFYRAPMNIERGRFAAFHGMQFSMRKKLNGDKAVLGLRLSDPFNTSRFRINVADDNVLQITKRSFGVRSAWLTLQLNYGQAPRIRERPQEPADAPRPFP